MILAPSPTERIIDLIDTKRVGARMIYGCASTPTVDTNELSISSAGCDFQFPIPLLAEHGMICGDDDKRVRASSHAEDLKIGDVVWLAKCESGIFIRAVLDDSRAADAAWELIERGEYKSLSRGGLARYAHNKKGGVVDGITYWDRWKLGEVSVCQEGANPDCKFAVLNASIARGQKLLPVLQPMDEDLQNVLWEITRKEILQGLRDRELTGQSKSIVEQEKLFDRVKPMDEELRKWTLERLRDPMGLRDR
jgi:hypothetical protein